MSELAPLVAVIIGSPLVIWVVYRIMLRREQQESQNRRFERQATVAFLILVAVVLAVMSIPSNDNRELILGILGLILTTAVALSSTTFVSNAIAGLMLRVVNNFHPGDFVQIGEQFGRVTERGLFSTEIQTEDRDLSTIPNLLLISQPVTVVRASGTIISATVSLGYDLPHNEIEELLSQAASAIGLENAFVHILDLGDFSITYRVAGFLPEVKQLLTTRSRLRASMLDTLHNAGVEIVSPTFMNQRQISTLPPLIPGKAVDGVDIEPISIDPPSQEPTPEDLMFDKAERAGELDDLRNELETLQSEIQELESQLSMLGDQENEAYLRLQNSIQERQKRMTTIVHSLEEASVDSEEE